MAIDPNSIELTDDQKLELARAADQAGKPWPDVFAEAVANYRPRQGQSGKSHLDAESLLDALVRDELLGAAKGLPPDLSTNPTHLEDFGRDTDNGAD